MPTRREIIASTAAAVAAGLLTRNASAQAQVHEHGHHDHHGHHDQPAAESSPHVHPRQGPAQAAHTHDHSELGYRPVVTPDGSTLPFKIVDGVKVFHLIAQPVLHTFAPGLVAQCWGYNGQVHGPTIEALEGDRVRVYVTNLLDAPTTVHWHGVILPSGMDGVGGLNQAPIQPGETFRYEWTFLHPGTFMYHSHHDEMTQMAMGMMGMIVVHPRKPAEPPPDRDYVFMLSEWAIKPGSSRPDPNEMKDFNVLTFNGKCFPGTTPITAAKGERVRLRFGNLSGMDHHPIHLHGYAFETVATDGGIIPPSARYPETTVLVPTGATRDVQFIADNPGDWAMHCHMTHHVMNQMGHDIPNVIGVPSKPLDEAIGKAVPGYMAMGETGMGDMGEMEMDIPVNSIPMKGAYGPHGYITMGGMFTILKVRQSVDKETHKGWYDAPPDTIAREATTQELKRDGIPVNIHPKPANKSGHEGHSHH